MTGFAVVTRETAGGTLTIELKSVNSRFLDLQFRMNDDLRALEPGLREAIMARVTRGKVECRVSFGRKAAGGAAQALNTGVLDGVAAMQAQVRQRFADAPALSVGELLRWPGVIEEAQLGQDTLQAAVSAAMQDAMAAFIESRAREGAALQAMLEARVDDLQKIVVQITPLVPQIVAQFQQRAIERMQSALGLAVDGAAASASAKPAPATTRDDALDRIRQEVTLYGIRIDVAEELTRLGAHLSETHHLLIKGGQVGKRLDFMMQELNREANTVGSKASAKELSDAAMAMKLLIEQMREQVQNLE
ncbi:MAG: YicC family protein [Herminiimonas sp.]|nr:YicC family protein [Herminiimonas sp.]